MPLQVAVRIHIYLSMSNKSGHSCSICMLGMLATRRTIVWRYMRSNFMLLLLLIINVKYRYTDTVAAEEQQYCNVIFSDVEYHKNISVYWQLVWCYYFQDQTTSQHHSFWQNRIYCSCWFILSFLLFIFLAFILPFRPHSLSIIYFTIQKLCMNIYT